MEVRTEPGIMMGRESFSAPLQQSHVSTQPSIPNMRISFASDGSTIYKPANSTSPNYQGVAGGDGAVAAAARGAAEGDGAFQPIVQHGMNMNMGGETVKKRGRPRKYGPEGAMTSGLSPVNPSSMNQVTPPSAPLSSGSTKKRGRPPGSVSKIKAHAAGTGFVPHIFTVQAGEDVSSKIISFTQCGPRAVCILSANGAISNVTLYQATKSGGTVTYEGRFEILSLSGSFLLSKSGGQRTRTGGLSISMAGADGRVLGGGVAGLLVAASPVQIVLGSFIADGKKEPKRKSPSEPPTFGAKLPPPGSETGLGSPPSHGTQSESSGGPVSST